MSWSISAIGRPDAVVRKIKSDLEKYQVGSQSRDEFEAAATHLIGLVEQASGDGAVISLSASGHATMSGATATSPGQRVSGQISVKIEQAWGFVE